VSDALQVAHVLPRLGLTGPVRALVAFAKHAARLGLDASHQVLTLEPAASPIAERLLRRAGIECDVGLGPTSLDGAIAAADVTLVHWWSCPSMTAFLRRPGPASRRVLWAHVNGGSPPQVLTRAVTDAVDAVLLTSPGDREVPALQLPRPDPEPLVVPAVLDVDRLESFARVPHDGVVIGYLGTVNRSKMHPHFAALCAAVDAPDARFVVFGAGGGEQELREEADALGLGDRFEVRGFTLDVVAALGEMDVFGYPLDAHTYASSDLALFEAMWVGIPPVVFPSGGNRHFVQHGHTGLVASDDSEYAAHVTTLARDSELREALGRQARDVARRELDPTGPTLTMDAALQDCAAGAPHEHAVLPWGATPGEWFAHSLGPWGEPFHRDLAEPGEPAATAAIARIDDGVAGAEGGLYHWSNAFPEDPTLRRWARIRGGAGHA
jgi:Glycosyl transferases group 1